MTLRRMLCGATGVGALLVASAWGQATMAQTTQAAAPTVVEEVTVTGSFIAGTPEDAAIPVNVIGRAELEAQGSPSALELIKTLPIIGPVLGDSNQFSTAAQGRAGGGTINLRGLGSQRTLVLLNGRRFAGYTADTNMLPIAAIGRIEILKDGAAATYGSDAIGGVANFITRTDLRGLEAAADYRFVDGSNGDYTGSVLWGWGNDTMNVLLAFGYQHRSELSNTARSYVTAPYLTNPSGWSVLGQPGAWTIRSGLNGGGASIGFGVDGNCTALGGFAGFTGGTPAFYFSYIPFDNLVEDQTQYQAYGEVNYHITSTTRLHVEAMYSHNELPAGRTSPGYPPTSGPNGPGSVNVYNVPATNPGFNTFLTQSGNAGLIGVAQSALATLWRPLGNGGNPLYGGLGGNAARNEYEQINISADLRGEVGFWGIGYDASITYIGESRNARTNDILIDRLQRSLNGLGGPGCNSATPGLNGCQYFNPFSNAYPNNPALGLTNPGFVAANANDPNLIRWMFDTQLYSADQRTWVGNVVFNGRLPISLWGGQVGWAAGAQYRTVNFTQDIGNSNYNANLTPCPVVGVTNCQFRTGPYIFLGQNIPLDLTQDVWAAFAEFSLPITDTIDAQLAVRHEDYGGLTGATTNPQFRIKWQATDWFALRGSVGTSFRGPTSGNVAPTGATGLAGLNAAGGNFKSVDFFGNPALGPESATTYSVGAIVRAGGFTATLDYWHYQLTDQIVSVPAQIIASGVFGVGNGSQFALAGACAGPLAGLLTFAAGAPCVQGVTVGNDIARVRSPTVNGPTITTDGIDFDVNYRYSNFLRGEGNIGGSISYVMHYTQDAFLFGGQAVSPAYEAAGFTNYDRLPGTIPRWRGQFYFDYAIGPHNLRIQTQYTDGATDNRGPTVVQTGPSTTCSVANVRAAIANATPSPPNCQLTTFGNVLGAYTQVDATYRLTLPWNTTVTFTAQNVFDQEPAGARLELSYDPFIGNALGRTFKIGVRHTF